LVRLLAALLGITIEPLALILSVSITAPLTPTSADIAAWSAVARIGRVLKAFYWPLSHRG
jgi:hypothetical protein